MYEDFFRLNERPFPSAPRIDFYYPASSAENAHRTLARCIERAEGPGLLIGGAGTGKSLLCQLLAARFREAFHVVMLASARLCTRRALLQNILFELDLPYRGLEKGELRLSLMDFLQPEQSNRQGMLLLVDEAHTLPLRLLEEIRMITNLVRNGQPRVRLVLVGGQTLEERLASRKLQSLNQRIAARCYLQPLNYEETFEYVRAQIHTAGGNADEVFSENALAAIHHATDGVPRLVNQVCDHALLLAVVNEQKPVDARLIEEAWADLQQLPAPSRDDSTKDAPGESVIEFGALEEPDLAETPVEDPVIPEPTFDAGEVDLTEQLDKIETCVAQVEEDPGSTVEWDPGEQPADAVPAAEDAALGAESPAEATHGETEARGEAEAAPEAAQTENPFDESFDDEETVVDHYARLHDGSSTIVTAAPMGGDRELDAAAEAVFQGYQPTRSQTVDGPNEPPTPEPVEETDDATPDGEPFHEAGETIVQADRECDHEVHVMRAAPPDDSDLIVVVDGEGDSTRVSGDSGKSHRQEYRRLFSRLRQT